MKQFTTVRGKAMTFSLDDCDTDQIAPSNLMRSLSPDYENSLFGNRRRNAIEKGAPLDFDLPQFKNAPLLVTGANFGCGSAREVAVWALAAKGIRCLVARSFAPVFRESCLKNGLLPVVLQAETHANFHRLCKIDAGTGEFSVDLEQRTLTCPHGEQIPFEFDEHERETLLAGLDDVAATLRHIDAIRAWEEQCRQTAPWLQQATLSAKPQ